MRARVRMISAPIGLIDQLLLGNSRSNAIQIVRHGFGNRERRSTSIVGNIAYPSAPRMPRRAMSERLINNATVAGGCVVTWFAVTHGWTEALVAATPVLCVLVYSAMAWNWGQYKRPTGRRLRQSRQEKAAWLRDQGQISNGHFDEEHRREDAAAGRSPSAWPRPNRWLQDWH